MNNVSMPMLRSPAPTGHGGIAGPGLRLRSAGIRLALIASLAVALLVGSLAQGPSAGAVPQIYTCDYALDLMDVHMGLAQFWFMMQDFARADYHYDAAWAYFNYC